MALALGEGGGSTTPDEWLASVLVLAGVPLAVPAECRGEDSAVALPPSDCSLGICTFNLGRAAFILALFVRDGGWLSPGPENECVLCGTGPLCGLGGGGVGPAGLLLWTLLISTDCDRLSFSTLISLLGSLVVVPKPQCCAKSDRLSSIGVNMLRDLAGTGFGMRLGWFS